MTGHLESQHVPGSDSVSSGAIPERDMGTGGLGTAVRISRFQAAVAVLMFAAGALLYSRLPERIPMHWNIHGAIDQWGEKSIPNLFFQPLMVVLMMLLAWALPHIDPFKKSYARFHRSYYLIIDLIVAFLALLYGFTLYAAFNTSVPIGIIVPAAVGLLLAVIGNQLAKVRRNFFVGFRTPWTLASETVWTRTHRIGARIFMLAGLGAALCAFLPAPANMIVFLILVLGSCAAIYVMSYLIYRRLNAAGELGDRIADPRNG